MEMNKDIESQKKLASQWFKSLRDDFCKTFENFFQKNFPENLGTIKEKVAAR